MAARAILGPGLATPCPIFISSLGGTSTDDKFSGSRAGATFCLAMISIGRSVKSRASQRCRNNCLMVKMQNGAPANFAGGPHPPHHAVSEGGGGVERSHGTKTNYVIYLLYAMQL